VGRWAPVGGGLELGVAGDLRGTADGGTTVAVGDRGGWQREHRGELGPAGG
jgi:hypothetical protein